MDDTTRAHEVAPVRLEFTGRGGEYFRIWIVNLALTIATLGIYSAWAKVRRLRYFHGHTQLAGHRFSYLADPIRILKGRIIALLFLGAYSLCWNLFPSFAFGTLIVGIMLVPTIIVTSMSFTMRNTAYRNVRFRFHRDYREAYRIYLVPALIVLTIAGLFYALVDPKLLQAANPEQEITRRDLLPLGVWLGVLPLIPWLDYLRCRFLIDHTQFGDRRAKFSASAGQFFWMYVKLLLLIALCCAAGLGISFSLAAWGGKQNTSAAMALIGPGLAMTGLALLWFMVSFDVQRGNVLRNQTRFGDNRLEGRLRTGSLLWLNLSNMLFVMLTLGLYVPFAQIRIARYYIERTAVDATNLEAAVAIAEADHSALGEELGEAFDIDLGL